MTPTPASRMDEAEKIVDELCCDEDPGNREVQQLTPWYKRDVALVATALHSIQAQTIREMVKVADEKIYDQANDDEDFGRGVIYGINQVQDAIKSYAKERNVEL